MIAAGSLFTPLARHAIPSSWASPIPGYVLLDVILLIALVALAARSPRYWPMSVAALQLLSVLTHASYAAMPGGLQRGYAYLQGLWAWPMLLIVIWASLSLRRRQRDKQYSPHTLH